MTVRTSNRSKTGKIPSKTVSRTRSSLQGLPVKAEELIPLQAAIQHLRVPIRVARERGYSYQELAALLQQSGIVISASTLKRYLAPARRRSSGSRTAAGSKSRRSIKSVKGENSRVEVSISPNSKTKAVSYVVGSDFWKAYQESLREREEVYRRLAES